jgi:hypothetical protein
MTAPGMTKMLNNLEDLRIATSRKEISWGLSYGTMLEDLFRVS